MDDNILEKLKFAKWDLKIWILLVLSNTFDQDLENMDFKVKQMKWRKILVKTEPVDTIESDMKKKLLKN